MNLSLTTLLLFVVAPLSTAACMGMGALLLWQGYKQRVNQTMAAYFLLIGLSSYIVHLEEFLYLLDGLRTWHNWTVILDFVLVFASHIVFNIAMLYYTGLFPTRLRRVIGKTIFFGGLLIIAWLLLQPSFFFADFYDTASNVRGDLPGRPPLNAIMGVDLMIVGVGVLFVLISQPHPYAIIASILLAVSSLISIIPAIGSLNLDNFALTLSAVCFTYAVLDENLFNPLKVTNQQLLNANQRLIQANAEATAATRAKRAFLSCMSHELRTPMSGVIGMSTLLMDTRLDNEQTDIVRTIQDSSQSLLQIIDDILDFSKIEADQIELQVESFDLCLAIEATLDMVALQASEKGINLAYFIGKYVPRQVIQDRRRVQQVLANLISNAVKFTERGEVILTVTTLDQIDERIELHFTVEDTGIGIPPERADRLFHPFSQVDTSVSRRFGGTGLGLVISKSLVELLGGKIWLESELGVGSTFHFTVMVEEDPNQAVFAPDLGNLRGKNVLVMVANRTNLRLIEQHLTTWQVNVSIITSLEDVSQSDDLSRFEAVIFERSISDKGAYGKFFEFLSHHPNLSSLIVLDRGEQLATHRDSRAVMTVSKPIRPSVLHDALVTTLAEAQQLQPRSDPQPPMVLESELPSTPDVEMPKILLVEDNLINQKVALKILERHGYAADVANDGEEAIEALQQQLYDIILMDINMPKMDGVTATQEIRSNWPPEEQPFIIAVTANAMEGDRERFLASGMDDYVSKPIRLEALLESISKAPSVTTHLRTM